LVGLPGWGIYNSTKFAVEGLSEALAEELAHLGIRVTLVNPGPFRTNFLGGSLTLTERKIDAYAESAGKTRQYAVDNNQRQVGDPARAAHAIIAAVLAEQPPLHLPLGAFAHERASLKLDQLRTEYAVWRDVALAADFPDEKSA
jgi:NAD(P)-dependent dehydrogenase (short-subunit alcohol dehydrogenase family)